MQGAQKHKYDLEKVTLHTSQSCAITTYLVMNADTEAAIDVVCVKEPPSVDQQQVEVVHCRGLNYPIHLTWLILKMVRDQRRQNDREVKKGILSCNKLIGRF